ncbi:MAG: thiolase family protein [Deltaproteobacteria bacterium]|nr:thiolase family protein [Deltaproteobacteria bacterium]
MRSLNDIVFVSAVRAPMGRFGGTLKDLKVYDLAAFPIREALRRANVAGDEVEDAIIGTCRQAGNLVNPARTAALKGGCGPQTPGVSLNKACPAGMKAVSLATQLLQVGQAEVVLTGGMESMSTIPHLVRGYRWKGFGMGPVTLEDGWSDSHDPIADLSMGLTAENLVVKYGLTRDELDEFAAASHNKAAAAQKNGWFDEQITSVVLPAQGKNPEVVFSKDESIRYEVDTAAMAKLAPAFKKDGVITAGNSCGLTDGAAFLVAMTREQAAKRGVKPLFSVVNYTQTAVDGKVMGEGPGVAIPKVLQRAGMALSDMDLIEVNEAFAAQILANERMLGWDRSRLNVHGGAIALGHPTGCSGARILVTLYYALKALDKELGVASICGGGGSTMAMIIRRES